LKQTDAELDDYELQDYFSQFGEVKAIRVPHFKKTTAVNPSHYERNQQRLVEFYDSRACVDAFDNTYEREYKGGKWDVAFFWDHPYK
jgi:RNA recognition motif-containing protein